MEQSAIETVNTREQQEFNPWVVYLVCLGLSSLFMFFFGLNSPLHTFNTHCDYQWFTTMGRGMLAGKVPYRDLFEQKGPITYVVFAVANIFAYPQFVIWCFEIVCISLFLFFCYRIARKFLSPWLSLLTLPLMMMVLSTNYVRGLEGSCVEEYCYPIFAYGFLCFLDFIMDRKIVTWRRSFALGICFGILFWVKYAMLEFFIMPLLIWVMINIIEHKFSFVVKNSLGMLCGFVLITIPIVIWFAILGALDDLFRVYFMINISRYNGDYQASDGLHYMNPWSNFGHSFFIGAFFCVTLICGLVGFAIRNWRRKKSGWLLLLAVIPTWLMIGFFCGYLYYYLPLYTYAILGVIYVIKIIAHMFKVIEVSVKQRVFKIVWLITVTAISFLVALPLVTNMQEINRSRNQYAQLVVADMITEYNQTAEKPATMFCYHMADCGFYNAAGIVPNVRYYAQNSFTETNFPEMFEDFDNTIKEQLCDFVITYRSQYNDLLATYYHPYIENNLEKSTIPFVSFEPSGYIKNRIVILYRN